MTVPLLLFLVLALAPTPQAVPADRGSPAPVEGAWVLDSGAKTLVYLDLARGERQAVLSLGGAPEFLLQSPAGDRLVVLDRGPGRDKGTSGYKATGKSTAIVVDSVNRTILARVELCAGVDGHNAYFSPDGRRLTLLCPGYESKKAADTLARELVNIDPVTGVETGRATLEHGTVPVVSDAEHRTLTLIQGLPRGSLLPYPQVKLWIVNLARLEVIATFPIMPRTKLDCEGTFLYLLDPGRPHKDKRLNWNGSLGVTSLERAAVEATLDAGRDPRGIHLDKQGGTVLVPSDGPSDAQGTGELRVIRGATLVTTIGVASNPRLVVRRGSSIFVVGERAVTIVDPGLLQATATIPLLKGKEPLVGAGDVPTELEVSADGTRAFILYAAHNGVVVLDLEARIAVGSTTTGREGKRVLGSLGGLLPLAAGFAPSPWNLLEWVPPDLVAQALGYSFRARVTPRMLALRADGRFGYAINSQTRDVTVVEATTAEAVERIGSGGYELRLLPGGHVLAVLSGKGIHLLDTATNKKLRELELHELRSFEIAADGKHAVAIGKRVVLCLDGTTGEVRARLTDFVDPVAVALEGSGRLPGP